MPAPTALLSTPAAAPESVPLPQVEDMDLIIDASAVPDTNAPAVQPVDDTDMTERVEIDEEGRPHFAPSRDADPVRKAETRKIPIPPHRFTPLKNNWPKIYEPLISHLKLQCRMNIPKKQVELRTSKHTESASAIQQGADFIKAFTLGFEVEDCAALLRLDNLYTQSFQLKDVKTFSTDGASRAIGRIAGKDGKTRFAIENATKTRVVVAGDTIHILGAFENINMARESIVSLILGKQPGKVYNNLRTIASRMKERF